jgi:hypothetical protein
MPSIEVTEDPARVELVALHAVVEPQGGEPAREFFFPPREAGLSRSEVLAYLDLLPKPVDCRARSEGDRMTITCRTMIDSTELADHTEAMGRSIAFVASALGLLWTEDNDDSMVVVTSGHERVATSLGTVRRWFEEYQQVASVWVRKPAEDTGVGAIGELVLGPGGKTTVIVVDSS